MLTSSPGGMLPSLAHAAACLCGRPDPLRPILARPARTGTALVFVFLQVRHTKLVRPLWLIDMDADL